jgi:divalent metal cation (Fe/Co/Zn/Cd) transporter
MAKVVASGLAAAAIAANATWGAAEVGRLADIAGAVLATITMLTLGIGMWRGALPHLLDRSLDEARQIAINRVLARRFADYDALGPVRSRLVGNEALVELTLGFAPWRTIGDIQHIADAVGDEVRTLIPQARVTVTPIATQAISGTIAAGSCLETT